MTPLVNGEVYHFESRGLYEGISTLWDEETESIWNHITGEAMYGPLEGYRLPVYNLLHTNAEAVLQTYPDLEVAISDRPIRERGNFFERVFNRLKSLKERFQNTMSEEDARRPTMEVGIGLWTDDVARYYPMEVVLDEGEALVDRLEGRGLVVYVEPRSRALAALYVDARDASWEDDELRLDTGATLRDGKLFNPAGERLEVERPLQLFTRWYGFALTFPGTEIYGE